MARTRTTQYFLSSLPEEKKEAFLRLCHVFKKIKYKITMGLNIQYLNIFNFFECLRHKKTSDYKYAGYVKNKI